MNNIVKLTKCIKPCKYKKYSFVGGLKPSVFKSDYVAFSLWALSENTRVATNRQCMPKQNILIVVRSNVGQKYTFDPKIFSY